MPSGCQPLAVFVAIGKRESCQQPLVIPFRSAITDFGKSEDPLQNAEGQVNSRTHFCLGRDFLWMHQIAGPREVIDAKGSVGLNYKLTSESVAASLQKKRLEDLIRVPMPFSH